MALGVVQPPCRDHAHRIRTTGPCPPGRVNLAATRRMSNGTALPAWICFTGGLLPGRRGAAAVVATVLGCVGTGLAGIGQLADVAGRRGRDDGGVEIRIVLDRAEPPAGRLRVVPAPGQVPGPRAEQDIGFSGWLGLLRALYEVTAEPGQGRRPGP